MTKEDMSKALSLSCVENYFLAYFKDKLDVRQLYVESFVSFNKVFADYTFLLAVIWKSKLSTGEVVSLEKIEKINTRLDNIILKEEKFCKFLIGELNE